jgi:hypothetical protein
MGVTGRPRRPWRATYHVEVAGLLSPMLRSTFADLTTAQPATATVFRVRLAPGQGPAEISAMLERKGLVLLRARPVPAPIAAPVAVPVTVPAALPVMGPAHD